MRIMRAGLTHAFALHPHVYIELYTHAGIINK